LNYGKAINKDSSSVYYNNRGLVFYHSGRLEEAKIYFEMAREKDHNDLTIYFNREIIFFNWEPHPQFELAHKDYDTALSITPNKAKLWHSKGLACQG
jgi:tetratricopeptide (TPR) repeat protein